MPSRDVRPRRFGNDSGKGGMRLTAYAVYDIIRVMGDADATGGLVHTDEFEEWWNTLEEDEKDDVETVVEYLAVKGLALGMPHCSSLKGSEYPLRELRPRAGASPIRVIYAYDPKRDAVLILGGDKSNDKKFYERMIEKCEAIWRAYLVEQEAGLHDGK